MDRMISKWIIVAFATIFPTLGWAQVPCPGGLQTNCPSPYYDIVNTLSIVNAGPTTIGAWATSARPASPTLGMMGFNTTTGNLETWGGSSWIASGSGSGAGTVTGPVSSTNLYVPQWNGTAGTALGVGLPVGTTGVSTILETDGSGYVSVGVLSGSYTGITGVGTLTAGVWNGTAIGNAYLANTATP